MPSRRRDDQREVEAVAGRPVPDEPGRPPDAVPTGAGSRRASRPVDALFAKLRAARRGAGARRRPAADEPPEPEPVPESERAGAGARRPRRGPPDASRTGDHPDPATRAGAGRSREVDESRPASRGAEPAGHPS